MYTKVVVVVSIWRRQVRVIEYFQDTRGQSSPCRLWAAGQHWPTAGLHTPTPIISEQGRCLGLMDT